MVTEVVAPSVTAGQVEASHRRDDIQGLRGIAVLLVVVFHAGLPLTGGFIGVDVFFVLSGFVITALLVRELSATGRLVLREFYARRFRRLMPPFALASVVTLLSSVFLLSPTGAQQEAANTAMASSVFGSNVYLYRFGRDYFSPAEQNPFVHTWSLAVEEQVYFVFPLTLLLLWAVVRRARDPHSALAAAFVGVAFVSFVLSVVTTYDIAGLPIPLPEKFAFYLPFTRIWEFAVGASLALLASRVRLGRIAATILGAGGLALVMASAVLFDNTTAFPGWLAAIPVAGTGAMLIAGVVHSPWQRAVSMWPLVRVGDVSYEWYLWHWPAIVLVSFTWPDSEPLVWLAAAMSLPVAVGAKRFVGDRFRHDDRLRGRRALALVAVCMTVPLAVGVGLKAGAVRGWGVDSLADLVDAQQRSRSEAAGCDSILRTDGCVFDIGGEQSLVLVGDSHAAAVSDMVWDVAETAGVDFGVWTRPGCRFLLEGNSGDCLEWSRLVVDWLLDTKPDVLVLHVATGYPDPAGAATYSGRLASTIDRLDVETRVVLLEDVPQFPGSSVRNTTLLRANANVATLPLQNVLRKAGHLRSALVATVLDERVSFVRTVEALCEADICTQRSSVWLYRDDDHVTPNGALRIRPGLEEAVMDALTTK